MDLFDKVIESPLGGNTERLIKYKIKEYTQDTYLIFLRLKKKNTSFNQADWEGEEGDFQARSILTVSVA